MEIRRHFEFAACWSEDLHLVEERSEFALPTILTSNEGRFDFIFIDGWHTFDHTILDCFYAIRLLRVGGYLVLDDAHWRSVTRSCGILSDTRALSASAASGCRTNISGPNCELLDPYFPYPTPSSGDKIPELPNSIGAGRTVFDGRAAKNDGRPKIVRLVFRILTP